MGEIVIRETCKEDEHFLKEVYFSTRLEEVSAFGWDHAQQVSFLDMQFRVRQNAYKLQYPNAEFAIVVFCRKDVGSLIVNRSKDIIGLTDIAVLPEFRGKGIGKYLIKQLQAEAASKGSELVLHVDRSNTKARALYEKLGFVVIDEGELSDEMKWAPPKYTLRPVHDEDREFLLDVYQVSRELELAMTPWDEDQKRAFVTHQFDAQTVFYQGKFLNATHEIIVYEERPVGRIYVNRGENEIAILDFTILSDYRKKGIGTSIIRQFQGESKLSGKPLSIYIQSFNPSQKLFTGLGFTPVAGETIDQRFEWRAPK